MLFERYQWMTGEVEEAVLEMYLRGVSTRKIAAVTEGLSRIRIGEGVVSRIARRLEEEFSAWRRLTLTCTWTPTTSRGTGAGGWWTWSFGWRWG